MESAHKDQTAKAPQMSLLSLCALLFRQSNLFLICVVLTYNDSMIIPRKTCQIPRNCQCRWLLVSSSAAGTSLGSSGSPEKILICTGVSVSMIVPRLTVFTKNLLICSNQVTKMFRSGRDCTSTSSARSPCDFRLQADITIWVLRTVLLYTVLTRTQFHFCSRLHWNFMRWLGSVLTFLALGFPKALLKYFHQPNSSWIRVANHAIHAIYLVVLLLIPHFCYCFRFLWIHAAAGLPEALHSYFQFFLVLDLRCICWHQIRNPVMQMIEK